MMINGIINVHKEKGFTSHDVVAKLRGIVGQRKIGHTGTLDPDATGVLPVCLGKGTKLCDLLTDKDKTYETVLLLGKETDTQDISGQVLNEAVWEHLSEEEVKEAIVSFLGDSEQIPPMYSALKVNGKKLYELAREGKVVERKARPIRIKEINILDINLPEVRMEISCSKGTYIRTICHDIGIKLGTYGCMKELIRTRVSRFEISDSYTLSELQELKDHGELLSVIAPVDSVFQDVESFVLLSQMEFLALNGNPLKVDGIESSLHWANDQQIRVYLNSGEFVGIYLYKSTNKTLKLRQMFLDRDK